MSNSNIKQKFIRYMQKEAKKAQEDNPKITEERERKEMEYEKDRGKLDADEQEIVIKVQ